MSEADKILMDIFENKQESYSKGKLECIEFKTNYKYIKNNIIKFHLTNKRIEIDGVLDIKELKAINLKCKELGWIEE